MADFLNEKDKKQFVINQLWNVANSDETIADDEKEVIRKVGISLGFENAGYKDVSIVSLSDIEKAFCLREMYRVAYADDVIKNSELQTIQKFVESCGISDELNDVTKKWAEVNHKNEMEYYGFLEKINCF